MKNTNVLNWLIGAILIVGGINWGMIGLFDVNLVSALFGELTTVTRTVYILVGLSAVYIAGSAMFTSATETTPRSIRQQV